MIYHVVNGKTIHLTPGVINLVFQRFGKGQVRNKPFFCITTFGLQMLYSETGDIYSDQMKELGCTNYIFFDSDVALLRFLIKTGNDDSIVFHSVQTTKFWMKYNLACMFNHILARRSSIICWGEADFTMGKTNIKKRIVRLMIGYTYSMFKAVITLSTEDEKKLKCMYKDVNGVYLPYPSTKKGELFTDKNTSSLNIMVSHSGWPHNNHLESFKLIRRFSGENIDVHCPLCYGDPEYIKKIVEEGKSIFGKKFHYFTELKPIAEYKDWAKQMDIYISAANIQTGLGAIFNTMNGGAKVFVKGNLYSSLKEEGYYVYDFNELKSIDFEILKTPMPFEKQKYNVDLHNEKHCDGKELIEKWIKFFEE